jgi:ABC-type sugar transport system substrate-binding protein
MSGFEMQYDYQSKGKFLDEELADTPYNKLGTSYNGASRETAYENMANYLVANDKIDWVACFSDEFALGAYQAIEEAGKLGEIAITSQEVFQATIPHIEDGTFDLSITQTGTSFVLKLEECIQKYINGETLEYNGFVEHIPVTQENAAEILPTLAY